MGSVTFTISYQKNAGQVISASEMKALYLTGLPLTSPNGVTINDDVIDQYIKENQDGLEDLLNIKLNRMAYQEDRDFNYSDWIQWGYLSVSYPVVDPYSLQGFLNTTLQISYPKEWLSAKQQVGDVTWQRNISLVPLQGSVSGLSGTSIYVGVSPYVGYFGNKTIPNYWKITYITGFNKVPQSIFKALSLMTKINLLALISFNVSQPGIAGKSIGIDGLSQSVTTTANANKIAFGALADFEQTQLDKVIDTLKSNYAGIVLGSL